MSRIIEVTVAPNGETTVQTKGYVGAECQAASRFIEQALGLTVTDHKTADYYQTIPAEQSIRQ